MSDLIRPDDWQLSQRQIDAAVAMEPLWGAEDKQGMVRSYWGLVHSPEVEQRLAEWEAGPEVDPVLDEVRKLMLPGLIKVQRTYVEAARQWPSVFKRMNSKVDDERFAEMRYTGLAQCRVRGAPITRDNAAGERYVYHLSRNDIALGTGIGRSMIDDGLFQENFASLAMGYAESFLQTEEFLHANVFNVGNVYNASVVGDGCPMFWGKHPYDQGTYSNICDFELNEASLGHVAEMTRALPDAAGLRANARAVTLVVPVHLEFQAHRLMRALVEEESKLIRGYQVLDYLTNPKAWFVTTSVQGLVSLQWHPFKLDLTVDGDALVLEATQSYLPGYHNPRACFGSFPA